MKRILAALPLLVSAFLAPAAAAAPLDPPHYDYYTSINLSCKVANLPGYYGYNVSGSDYAPNSNFYYEANVSPAPARRTLATTLGSRKLIKTSASGTFSTSTFYGQYAKGTELRGGVTVYTTPTQSRSVGSDVKYCVMQ